MLLGIIGKANVGKTSFLAAATLAPVKIANYPFTTLKPNLATGFVKVKCIEQKFNVKCKPKNGFCIDGYRFIPVRLLDVAGLVPGAHLGKGKGTAFLDDLRRADVLIHVVDISGTSDEQGNPAKDYDPANDIRFVEQEIDLWFLSIIKKNWDYISKKSASEKEKFEKMIAEDLAGLGISENQISQALLKSKLKNKKPTEWKEEDFKEFVPVLRNISKPMIIAANKMDLPNSKENLGKLKREFSDKIIVPACAEAELALRKAEKEGLIKYVPGEDSLEIKGDLSEKQKKGLEFIQKNILDKNGTGVQEILNKSVFDVLDCIVVYPVADINKLSDKKGNVLPDVFLVKKGTTLKDFAFQVHSDIGEKFIGGIEVKNKRKLGADYELKNNDVVEILFGKR